ncbi:UNVERIFIED_CONTAM: hypothetical protein K2H54_072384, partial [Gekko kuhli]
EVQLIPKDPRWVGAWWLGFVFSSALAAVSAVPYFFFPREMQKEKEDPHKATAEPSKSNLLDEQKGRPEDLSLWQFIKMFPVVLIRNLKNPFFVMTILALINLSAMVAGLATFLGKFLESQFTLTASVANMLIGAVNLPMAMVGILLGGFIMKKLRLSLKQSTLLCLTSMGFCLLFKLPLFFLGCPTQAVAGLNHGGSSAAGGGGGGHVFSCNQMCNCSSVAFNPICGQDHVEYISPCHAGCSALQYDAPNKIVLNYTKCNCIVVNGALGSAVPGTCSTKCSRVLIPFLVLSCVAGFLASLTQTPAFMLILRNVKAEDKSFAIGIQFLLLRVAAWLPAPVVYGSVIDTACLLWQWKCQKKAACRYYNNTAFRHRFIGLQVWFEACCFLCLAVVYYLYWKQGRSQRKPTEENRPAEGPEQAPEAAS